MEKIDLWQFDDEKKVRLYTKVSKDMKLHEKAVEKDWWVCHVIRAVFMLECAPYLTFKGGTSLSKAWGIEGRFSEDVDISIDKSFFGLTGDTRSQRDRIRKLSREYFYDKVMTELGACLFVTGAAEHEIGFVRRKDSDADPSVFRIPYHTLLPELDYLKGEVKIEFSCRNMQEPRQMREIKPYICSLVPQIDFEKTVVPTVVPTRTFLEKIFLLHEEYQKDYPRHNRMSRHLYDLAKLADTEFADKALSDKALYCNLVRHRSIFNAIRGIDYSKHLPRYITIVPPENIIDLWREDYAKMQSSFIYEESPSFDVLIAKLQALQEKVRLIDIDAKNLA